MAMSKLGKVLRALGTMREYKNGSSHGFVWRWFNPLVWVIVPVAYLLAILFQGIPETFRYPHEMGMCVDPYFKKNGKPVIWLSRF